MTRVPGLGEGSRVEPGTRGGQSALVPLVVDQTRGVEGFPERRGRAEETGRMPVVAAGHRGEGAETERGAIGVADRPRPGQPLRREGAGARDVALPKDHVGEVVLRPGHPVWLAEGTPAVDGLIETSRGDGEVTAKLRHDATVEI